MHRFDDGREVQPKVRGARAQLQWAQLIPLAIAGIDAIGKGLSGGASKQMDKDALNYDKQKYAERKPFRDYAMQGLANADKAVDSQSIFQSKANPFAANFNYAQDLGANRNAGTVVPPSAADKRQAQQRAFIDAVTKSGYSSLIPPEFFAQYRDLVTKQGGY